MAASITAQLSAGLHPVVLLTTFVPKVMRMI